MRLICAVFSLLIFPVPIYALTPGQVFDKVKHSVVVVKTLDAKGKVKGQGSGVILPSGKVATNCHVVEGGASYKVGQGKHLVSAILWAKDGDMDICLLNAKGIKGKPAQFGKAAGLKVGDRVYAVGAPVGLGLSLSDGIVAQLRGGPSPLIQVTAAISPGSSGGGLFDERGLLVGLITVHVEGGQTLNFAMPVEWIGVVKPGRKFVAKGYSQTEWLTRSIVLEKREDWQGMLDWCQQWTTSEPNNVAAWHCLGMAYSNLNRYDDASKAYLHAIRINPEDYDAWFNLGIAYSNLNRYDDASKAYLHAIRINPEDYDAWFNLGVAYGNLNRHDDATKAYLRAIRINPKKNDAWFNLGIEYVHLGNRTAALNIVRELRRLDPAQADKLFSMIGPR